MKYLPIFILLLLGCSRIIQEGTIIDKTYIPGKEWESRHWETIKYDDKTLYQVEKIVKEYNTGHWLVKIKLDNGDIISEKFSSTRSDDISVGSRMRIEK